MHTDTRNKFKIARYNCNTATSRHILTWKMCFPYASSLYLRKAIVTACARVTEMGPTCMCHLKHTACHKVT